MIRRWLFTGVSVLSLLLCVATVVLWICEFPPERAALRIIGPVRGSIFGRSASLYNQSLPYSGSIIALSALGGPSSDPVRSAFDFAGVHYRCFRWQSGRTYWTLTLPTLYLVATTLILPMLWLRTHTRTACRTCGHCPACGYDLRASKERCPECGTAITDKAKTKGA